MKNKVIEKIANKTGYSVSHITNVLTGRRNNEEITKLYSKLTTPKNTSKRNVSKTVRTAKVVKLTGSELIARVAKEAGYSISHVRKVVNGQRTNSIISILYNKYSR